MSPGPPPRRSSAATRPEATPPRAGAARIAAATLALAVGSSCAGGRAVSPPAASAGPPVPARALEGAPGSEVRVPAQYVVTVTPGAGEAPVREVFGELGILSVVRVGPDVFQVTFARDPGEGVLELRRQEDPLHAIRAVVPRLEYRAGRTGG